MEASPNELYLRSDGYAEDKSGEIAVVMLRWSTDDGTTRNFNYQMTFTTDPLSISWTDRESNFALLPYEFASGLLSKGWARNLTREEVDAVNLFFASQVEAVAAPVETPAAPAAPATPAATPTPPAAPQTAAASSTPPAPPAAPAP